MVDNFNAYTTAALNGQGSWSGSAEFLVSPDVPYEGAKGVKVTGAGVYTIDKSASLAPVGQLSIMMRKDVSTGGAGTYQTMYVSTAVPEIIGEIGMRGPDIQYMSNFVWTTVLANYSLATWYKLTILWRDKPSCQCMYFINDVAVTYWVPRGAAASTGPAVKTSLEVMNLSGGAIAYNDSIG